MRTTHIRRLSAAALVTILMVSMVTHSAPSQKSTGMFMDQTDVGSATKRGSLAYDAASDEYTITGSGTNMWFGRDEFHFVWKLMRGDFLLTTRARFVGRG